MAISLGRLWPPPRTQMRNRISTSTGGTLRCGNIFPHCVLPRDVSDHLSSRYSGGWVLFRIEECRCRTWLDWSLRRLACRAGAPGPIPPARLRFTPARHQPRPGSYCGTRMQAGGGEGSRTPVRDAVNTGIYTFSRRSGISERLGPLAALPFLGTCFVSA